MSESKALVVVSPNEVAVKAKVETSLIAQPQFAVPKARPKKRVLTEERYIESIGKIIERDFFPDLAKLRLHQAWLEAKEQDDFNKMREIQEQVAKRSRRDKGGRNLATPASFTPEGTPGVTDTPVIGAVPTVPVAPDLPQDDDNPAPVELRMGLDQFQMYHTSEDNASFDQIMDRQNDRRVQKYAYLLNAEAESKKLIEGPSSSGLLTWKYEAKNTLMYNKEGVAHTPDELINSAGKAPKAVVHNNTRFHGPAFDRNYLANARGEKMGSKYTQEEVALYEARKKLDEPYDLLRMRGGAKSNSNSSVDIQEALAITPLGIPEAPRVRGYEFLTTPSPAPGVDASPIMTWGTVEGTPLRLDPMDTPLDITNPKGPKFHFTQVSEREQLGRDLAEKAQKSRSSRITVSRAPQHHTSGRQRGSGDDQLRASYNSPSVRRSNSDILRSPRTPLGGRTPLLVQTPSPSPGRSRKSSKQ